MIAHCADLWYLKGVLCDGTGGGQRLPECRKLRELWVDDVMKFFFNLLGNIMVAIVVLLLLAFLIPKIL